LEFVIDLAMIGVLTLTEPHQSDVEVNDGVSATEARIHGLLVAHDGGQSIVTVAAAESLTGGNVAARITTNSGSSRYFLGSIVAYSNEAKASLLSVSRETLDTRGAVSAECAREMAEGARRAFGADLAVATTGIAGPGGATERKAVGLVYVGLAGPEGVSCEEFHFPGGRAVVTDAATEAALLMLLRGLERQLRTGQR
jgi:nicotinamide-nucleotide amidase